MTTTTELKGYAITKKVGKPFTLETTTFEEVSQLEYLQKAVGGYIECIRLENNVDIWINEEGKINGMKPNTAMQDKNGRTLDIIFGDFIVASHDEEGETIPLTLDQVRYFASLEGGTVIMTKGEEMVEVAIMKLKNV